MFSHQYITTPIFSPTIQLNTTHVVTTTPTSTIYHNYINNDNYQDYYNDYGVSFVYVEPKKLINIPFIGHKNIPANSFDTITMEEIKNNDILIDFKRDGKTEYEYNAFYKESTLDSILASGKNQFTLKPLNYGSIVKYYADVPE
jgi:hypothetical protein